MSKFKNTEELEKAYKELEKEFTKKSQKLAEVEKTNYVTLLHNEMDSLLNDYAKRRISDLEAKLAESEEQLKEELEEKNGVRRALSACNRQNDEFADMIKKLVSEKEELKQQLADKNVQYGKFKSAEELYKAYTSLEKEFTKSKQQLAEKEKQSLKYFNEYRAWKRKCDFLENDQIKILEDNQDKLSFAVEQLEKVKDKIKRLPCAITLTTSAFEQIYKVDATRQIDNQIKAIEEME